MPDRAKWAAYDAARFKLDMQVGEAAAALMAEEAKAQPDPAKVEALGAKLDALDLQSSLISSDDFSG